MQLRVIPLIDLSRKIGYSIVAHGSYLHLWLYLQFTLLCLPLLYIADYFHSGYSDTLSTPEDRLMDPKFLYHINCSSVPGI